MKTLKTVAAIVLLTTCTLSAAHSAESQTPPDPWEIKIDGETVRYVTSGRNVFGHQFGFLKKINHCDADVMWITWSTYSKDIAQYEGISPILEFQTSRITLRLDPTYLATATVTPKLSIVVFTNFLANEKLMALLASEKEVTVRIVHPQEFAAKFDIGEDSFDLTGFAAARVRATETCVKMGR